MSGESIDEVITRQEVYFTGKENIEGFACLVNVFLRDLVNNSYPALINVDNDESVDEDRLREG